MNDKTQIIDKASAIIAAVFSSRFVVASDDDFEVGIGLYELSLDRRVSLQNALSGVADSAKVREIIQQEVARYGSDHCITLYEGKWYYGSSVSGGGTSIDDIPWSDWVELGCEDNWMAALKALCIEIVKRDFDDRFDPFDEFTIKLNDNENHTIRANC